MLNYLRGISLTSLPLGPTGAAMLADGLAVNKSLRSLVAPNANLGAAGAALVLRSLTGHPSIRIVDLSWNWGHLDEGDLRQTSQIIAQVETAIATIAAKTEPQRVTVPLQAEQLSDEKAGEGQLSTEAVPKRTSIAPHPEENGKDPQLSTSPYRLIHGSDEVPASHPGLKKSSILPPSRPGNTSMSAMIATEDPTALVTALKGFLTWRPQEFSLGVKDCDSEGNPEHSMGSRKEELPARPKREEDVSGGGNETEELSGKDYLTYEEIVQTPTPSLPSESPWAARYQELQIDRKSVTTKTGDSSEESKSLSPGKNFHVTGLVCPIILLSPSQCPNCNFGAESFHGSLSQFPRCSLREFRINGNVFAPRHSRTVFKQLGHSVRTLERIG